MKKLYLLKALVDLLWFFSILTTIAIVIFIPIALIETFDKTSLEEMSGKGIVPSDLTTKLLLLGLVLAYFCFVYGLFLFRKVLALFSKKQIFDSEVIVMLNKIGIAFISASVIASLVKLASHIYDVERIQSAIEGGFFDSFLFSASLGLFFMVLSEVFSMGKNMKEENELTI